MIREVGAEYTDNLKSKNTHLICKEASGKKYEKACEWGLHVVSVDWLYHVVRFGYIEGCETKFSLKKSQDAPMLPNDWNDLPVLSLADRQVDPDLPMTETSSEVFQADKRDNAKIMSEPTKQPPTVDERHVRPKNEKNVVLDMDKDHDDAATKHMRFNAETDHHLESSNLLKTSDRLEDQRSHLSGSCGKMLNVIQRCERASSFSSTIP
jgi:topoisomerase (DNA) II binding protein 1